MGAHVILMADIVGSSKRKANILMGDFKSVVSKINRANKALMYSPLTITLGDEFQGVAKSIDAAVRLVFGLETDLMALKRPFKLRYVIHQGIIETKLNPSRAYEMMGPGLTQARDMLNQMKTSKRRFKISTYEKELEAKLNLMFSILQGLIDRWTSAQQKVAVSFIELGDYRKVAAILRKDPTTIWRRKKTLMIEEFNNLKELMIRTINGKWLNINDASLA